MTGDPVVAVAGRGPAGVTVTTRDGGPAHFDAEGRRREKRALEALFSPYIVFAAMCCAAAAESASVPFLSITAALTAPMFLPKPFIASWRQGIHRPPLVA